MQPNYPNHATHSAVTNDPEAGIDPTAPTWPAGIGSGPPAYRPSDTYAWLLAASPVLLWLLGAVAGLAGSRDSAVGLLILAYPVTVIVLAFADAARLRAAGVRHRGGWVFLSAGVYLGVRASRLGRGWWQLAVWLVLALGPMAAALIAVSLS